MAEESLQDAFVAAARTWPVQGVPDRPAAWLLTAAQRRAVDRIRREDSDRRRLPLLVTDAVAPEVDPGEKGDETVTDEPLRLLFACCHPALSADARAAMMLRFVAGLSTAEIARLFLVSEATMSTRLTRAKRKMAIAGIPVRTPTPVELADRLDIVLKVIYLVFTEGYRATAGPALIRPRLASEAIRLGYVLGELLPDEDRIVALLALMVLQHARRDARVDGRGWLVTLPDHDRDRWRWNEIEQGTELLARLSTSDPLCDYHLEALIAAEHCRSERANETDWHRIADLYGELERRNGSPIVRLNRAVAMAEAGSPEAALSIVDGLDAPLPQNHLVPAVRGELLCRLGRHADAVDAFANAERLARTDVERNHVRRRRDRCAADE